MYLTKVISVAVLLCVYRAVKGDQGCDSAINPPTVDFQMVMDACNSSFSIPMDYLVKFNATGSLPDEIDKTGMCYIRCFFEKSGLIHDWKLNKDLLRDVMWPATGDSIDVCEREESTEKILGTITIFVAQTQRLKVFSDRSRRSKKKIK